MTSRNLLGLVIISLLLIGKYAIQPWLADVDERRTQIEQLSFMNHKLSSLKDKETLIKQDGALLVESMDALKGRAFVGNNPSLISSEVLSSIKAIALESGVTLKNQSLGDFQPNLINILPVKVYTEGSVPNIVTFLALLEKHPKQFFVEHASISKRNSNSKKLGMNVRLLVMVIKDE